MTPSMLRDRLHRDLARAIEDLGWAWAMHVDIESYLARVVEAHEALELSH